jgi:hypothetical protein
MVAPSASSMYRYAKPATSATDIQSIGRNL